MIKHSDRKSILALLSICNVIWNDTYTETAHFISVPRWGRRFWFKTVDNVEFVERVEEFERVEE
jgi:hypothetical protein